MDNAILTRNANLIASDDMIANMLSNKKHDPIVTELFLLNAITQPYFAVPRNIRLNSKLYFTLKSRNKQERLIIHQILTLRTLLVFTINVL